MKLPGFCECDQPARTLREGVFVCHVCGERIPDPLLKRVVVELALVRRQLARVTRKLDADPPPDWIAPKEFAQRLGRHPNWVYRHADRLGAVRVGDGPRPRLLFPADSLGSDAFHRNGKDGTA